MADIHIAGLDRLYAKFRTIEGLRPLVDEIQACGIYLKGKIAQYPRATFANAPGEYPSRWYQRGYGPKWALKSGGVHGIKTSETLGRRWTKDSRDNGLTAVIGNNTSYGPYVQSEEDQTIFHGVYGWQTDEDIVKQERNYVVGRLRKRIEKMLESK